jgi:predicted transposase YdaD
MALTYNIEKDYFFIEGEKKGLEKGLEKGEQKLKATKKAMVSKLLIAQKLSLQEIADIADMTLSEVLKIEKELK